MLLQLPATAQHLQPGFNKKEYIELLKVSARTTGDTAYYSQIDPPEHFRMAYQSAALALDNRWDLWTDSRGVALISLRGTTSKQESWLENFYAAMVPAKGELQLGPGQPFVYTLAGHSQAAVHVGWLVGMAFLSKDILPRMDSLYQQGTRDFLMMGHSQGGAIAYLLTAHLLQLKKEGRLPADIQLKTYCSAAPKPGNLHFANEYEAQTQNGWAFNVVNAADWVPETPISIQTLQDFNYVNPFVHANEIIRKQKRLPNRVVMRHIYNQLNKPTLKAQQRYETYLGKMTSKLVVKQINGLEVPPFYGSNHYVRTGIHIVLQPDESYYKLFPDDRNQVFMHHAHPPYIYLTEMLATPFYSNNR